MFCTSKLDTSTEGTIYYYFFLRVILISNFIFFQTGLYRYFTDVTATVCPRSLVHFYIETSCMKLNIISWT